LREIEDMDYRDIAAVTNVPLGTVMSRLARARSALKKQWLRHNDGVPRAVP
jgi:RNA polymerase sigma-70 factor (ECF subfamily)